MQTHCIPEKCFVVVMHHEARLSRGKYLLMDEYYQQIPNNTYSPGPKNSFTWVKLRFKYQSLNSQATKLQ